MYSLNMPVSKIRTKIRQEFERHRYVKQLSAVDVLLAQSHMEFQVGDTPAKLQGFFFFGLSIRAMSGRNGAVWDFRRINRKAVKALHRGAKMFPVQEPFEC